MMFLLAIVRNVNINVNHVKAQPKIVYLAKGLIGIVGQ